MQETIEHIALPGLIPGLVALHHQIGLLAHLTSSENGEPHLQEAALFTDSELTLLVPLLANYPEYCPYEVLLASFGGSTSEKAVERARGRLYDAMDTGEWEAIMRPLRNVMGRVRTKINALSFDVVSMPEVGYRIMSMRPYRNRKRRGTSSNDMHIS